MRLATFDDDGVPRPGVLLQRADGDESVVDLAAAGLPTSIRSFLEWGDDALTAADAASKSE
jgi:hypothetical protein